MDINTTKYKWTQDKSEYTELIFETYLVLPSWEDQKKQVGFLIITHEIRKPWYSFKKKQLKNKKVQTLFKHCSIENLHLIPALLGERKATTLPQL